MGVWLVFAKGGNNHRKVRVFSTREKAYHWVQTSGDRANYVMYPVELDSGKASGPQ